MRTRPFHVIPTYRIDWLNVVVWCGCTLLSIAFWVWVFAA